MEAFRSIEPGTGAGAIMASRIEDSEADLLIRLAYGVHAILSDGRDFPTADDAAEDRGGVLARLSEDMSDTQVPKDTAVARLLPDGAPDDPEVSAEFRRLTQGSLRRTKVDRLRDLVSRLQAGDADGGVVVELTRADIGPFLATLTDIRLVLADRLAIKTDDDEFDPDSFPHGSDERATAVVYLALGWWQETALEALGTT